PFEGASDAEFQLRAQPVWQGGAPPEKKTPTRREGAAGAALPGVRDDGQARREMKPQTVVEGAGVEALPVAVERGMAGVGARPVGVGGGFPPGAAPRLPYRLRAQLEFGMARGLGWRGNTNYRASGARQPSAARLDTWQLLLAGFHDLPGWDIAPGRRAQPFLGAGLGITGYRLGGYVQRFPEPDDPQGSLRRGPGGEIPFTAVPGGSGRNFTWMLTTGIAITVSGNIHLELSYRYTDAGEIRTDVGDIAIVRYREDGARREIPARINETTADHRTHSLLAALRFEF
ncbi:MAG: hypothetical protein OXF79_27495, partial [Chloroflexi bacterium]|nr:hypothetical protein [Chloroflexota bacterium]